MFAHRVELPAGSPAEVRLVAYAKAHLVILPVAEVGALVAHGGIRIGDRPSTTRELVRAGDVLAAELGAAEWMVPQQVDVEVLHEDADLLVVEKPAGMHVHPIGPYRADTLLNALLWRAGARPQQQPWGAYRPAPAHRLDRAASGLVLIAKHAAAHEQIRRLFAAGAITRRYTAIVQGQPPADAGTIDAPLGRDPESSYRRAIVPLARGGQPACTHWRVVERRGELCELAVELETGRTHQIRAHLASIGYPIAGDTLYATPAGPSAARIALHACELVCAGRFDVTSRPRAAPAVASSRR